MYDDIPAFEEGPCFTEEGQFCDPEFVVLEENQTVNIEELEGWEQLVVNQEMIPQIDAEITIDPPDVEPEFVLADTEAVIYA